MFTQDASSSEVTSYTYICIWLVTLKAASYSPRPVVSASNLFYLKKESFMNKYKTSIQLKITQCKHGIA